MDIEDLFTEQEELKNDELVIPQFDPCSGEGPSAQQKTNQDKCCQNNKSLTCTNLQNQQEEQKSLTIKEQVDSGKVCFKCKQNPPNFTNKQDKVCKNCLLESIVHRFKASLRKNLKIWKDDLNLICISGGSNSMALLKLMHESLFGYSQKKMFFKVHILFIEEGSAVYDLNKEERTRNIEFIIDQCKSYGFTYTIIPLEQVFDVSSEVDLQALTQEECKKIEEEKSNDEIEHSGPINFNQVENKIFDVENIEERRKQLQELIKCLPTTSSFREDLIFYFKRWIISDFALKHNFKKVILGTNALKISTQLLTQLAKGRGLSIPHEINYTDDKNFGGRITFMNPMREFLLKEIALFNYINKVSIINQKSLAQINNSHLSGVPAFASTDYLIEKFFTNLQDKYNVNTVPTVVRLTNKLLKYTPNDVKYPFCPLCLGIRDQTNNLLEIGSTIKKIKVNQETGENTVEAIQDSDEWLISDLEKAFCFGCKRLGICATDKKSFINLLPEVIKINCQRTLESLQ